jgi:antirestriction protein ArdC
MNFRDLAADVAARLVAQITAGADGWRMPWHTNPNVLDVRNAATGSPYRGANTITLAVVGLDAGYGSGWWATYRQWTDLGAQVRRGETAARVVKWVPARSNDSGTNGNEEGPGSRLVPRVYPVFNASQIDGWTPPNQTHRPPAERNAAADAWIGATGANIASGYDHAAYLPEADRIETPNVEQFVSVDAYYATVCHELSHWTGHRTRLARDLTGRFGDDAYAVEELVAELGAAIACAHLGIAPTPRNDHASYCAHWLRILRADPTVLFATAAKAQAAVDHLDRYSRPEVTA